MTLTADRGGDRGSRSAACRRIAREAPIEEPGRRGCRRASAGVGRPSVVEEYRERIAAVLAAEPKLPTVEILHRLRGQGYAGGKTRALRAGARAAAEARHAAGALRGRGGRVLAARLRPGRGALPRRRRTSASTSSCRGSSTRAGWTCGWSRTRASSRWCAACSSGFESFGGVPLVAVFDNPKTVVLSREGGRIQWNDTFGQAALDYRFAPELCTPRRGQEKGSVENLVGFVEEQLLQGASLPRPRRSDGAARRLASSR